MFIPFGYKYVFTQTMRRFSVLTSVASPFAQLMLARTTSRAGKKATKNDEDDFEAELTRTLTSLLDEAPTSKQRKNQKNPEKANKEKKSKEPKTKKNKKTNAAFDDSDFWAELDEEAETGSIDSLMDQAYLQNLANALGVTYTPKEPSKKPKSTKAAKARRSASEDEPLVAVIDGLDASVSDMLKLSTKTTTAKRGKKDQTSKNGPENEPSTSTNSADSHRTIAAEQELAASIARLRYFIDTNNISETLPPNPASPEKLPEFPVHYEELADATQWLLSPMSASHPLILQSHTNTRRYTLNTYPLCPVAQAGERKLTEEEVRRVMVEPMSTDNCTTFMVRRSMILKDGADSAVRVQPPPREKPITPQQYDAERKTRKRKTPTDVLQCTLSVYNHRLSSAEETKKLDGNSPSSSSAGSFTDRLTITPQAATGTTAGATSGAAQHLRVKSAPLYSFYVSSQLKMRPLTEAIVKKRYGDMTSNGDGEINNIARNEVDIESSIRELLSITDSPVVSNKDERELKAVLESVGVPVEASENDETNIKSLFDKLPLVDENEICHAVSVCCVLHKNAPMYFSGIDRSSIYRAVFTEGEFRVPQAPQVSAVDKILGVNAPPTAESERTVDSSTLGPSPTAADIERYLAEQALMKKK